MSLRGSAGLGFSSFLIQIKKQGLPGGNPCHGGGGKTGNFVIELYHTQDPPACQEGDEEMR